MPESVRFRIDPMVVYKLGQELISDEVQALLELVKNAYDADASYVVVRIDTRHQAEGLLISPDEGRPGFIEVVDDGFGMERETIRNGWLLIARSPKLEFKRARKVTKKKRTPLGDKGLGRLGAQRLGWGLQIATKTSKAKEELVVAFSWEDFLTAETLDQVDVRIGRRKPDRTHGTTVTISELHNLERWRGDAVVQLQRQLSQVISPYEGVSGFTVSVTVDGAALDLQSLNRQVRDTAQLRYDIKFDGRRLTVSGRAKLAFFRPTSKKEQQTFADLVEADDGAEFFEHLVSSPGASDFHFGKGRGRWFITFEHVRELEDVVGNGPNGDGSVPNPGPFRAEVDSFDLGAGEDERQQIFGRLREYREFIRDLAGVRVFRDGFAVRVDEDWLGLGSQWTTARSYYGLKPATTTGYVAISSRENAQLQEKTDREGFTDTPEYRAFQALLGDFVTFTGEVQGKLRREFTTFFNARLESAADVSPDTSPEAVSESIDETLAEAEVMKASVVEARGAVSAAVTLAAEVADADPRRDDGQLVERSREAIAAVREAMQQAQSSLGELTEFLERVETAQARNRLVREEVIQLRQQLEQGVEAMGLGLTAEALSHEMFNIADSLATRTQEITRALKNGQPSDTAIRRYAEYVRGTIASLRKELAHFSPSLRYVREKRERLDMVSFTRELADYYGSRWRDEGITVVVSDKSKAPFTVRGSRGKITQVFDNLLLNSGYWLRQSDQSKGRISIQLSRPNVVVSDNGPGVEPSVEDSLFDPFVSRKPRGSGRGLGLFVVRQLLESDGCSIELGPRRNGRKRRYQFVLNLAAILDE